MGTDNILQRTSLILPVAHVVMCTLYLASMSYGFGSQLYSAISISNFFAITLNKLALIYIGAVLVPTLVLMAIDYVGPRRQKRPTAIQVIKTPKLYARHFGSFMIPIILAAACIIYGYVKNYYIPAQVWAMLLISYLYPIWLLAYDNTDYKNVFRGASFVPIMAVILVSAIGYDDGVFYRHRSYSDLSKDKMYCGDNAVLLGLGEDFLTVTKDNQRHLIDRDCRERFSFDDTYIVREMPFLRFIEGRR